MDSYKSSLHKKTITVSIFACLILSTLWSTSAAKDQQTARTIEFAGANWNVKSGGPKGPGPNHWSDSSDDIWVDEQGRLHMTIIKKDDVWHCTEVYTTEFSSYGEHRFLIEGFADRMDKQIVLGLFTYAADDAEVDIELSKWGSASNTKVGGYTLQPYYITGNNHKFSCDLATSKSTHYFNWQPDSVHFASYQGHHYGEPESPSDVIHQWVYRGDHIPEATQNLRTHINFWLFQGKEPIDHSVLHIIITDVVQPLSTDISLKETDDLLPRSWSLEQNYPNPFNPSTTIEFTLQEPTHMYMNVYNTRGERVKSLIDEYSAAGRHKTQWDATDDHGQPVASGVYFYHLQAGGKSSTLQKMLYIK